MLTACGASVLVVLGLIVASCLDLSKPLFHKIRPLEFLTGSDWDPVQDDFGALPFIYGTLVTSALAILVATPLAIGVALFLTELASGPVRRVVSFLIELLAGIPSVVYGLWGLMVLVPLLRAQVEPFLGQLPGGIPLFSGPAVGLGYLASGLLLAIMILPTITSLTVEVLRTVPTSLREGVYALGATQWEVVRTVVLPFARRGIFAAVILGLARALGETMAVTMVIGNQAEIHVSLFSPGYSLPSVIANEFTEATGAVHIGALAALALVLLGVTLLLAAGARVLLRLSEGVAA